MQLNQIPKLNTQSRALVSQGSDFVCYRFTQKAPALPEKKVSRMETWLLVPKTKLTARLGQENYVIETDCHSVARIVPFWEDNHRLARIDGRVFELIESKSERKWR